MRLDWVTRISLGVIAISLGVLAFRPVVSPPTVKANAEAYPFYVEPGVEMLRYPDGSAQVYGKVVIDMRTGKIWGFPTGTQSSYPIDTTTSTPPISRPVYLGKYSFGDVKE